MSTVTPSEHQPPTEQTPDRQPAADTVGEVVRQVKPKLRGWLHAGMAPLATAGGIVLVALAPDTRAADRRRRSTWPPRCCCSAPARSTTASTGVPRGDAILRRMDHANIYLFIAGDLHPDRGADC